MQVTQEKVSTLWKRLDVAKFFGVCTATIRRWERGEGGNLPAPACVVANRPRWRPEDVQAFLGTKSVA